jgi:peptidoglycan/LPS O-acetylase OafA/YrhL
VPFALGVYLLMPVGYFAVYRQTATDPSWSAYWAHLMALPFLPDGPLWFLWILLAFNVAAAVICWIAPGVVELLANSAARAVPTRLFMALAGVSALVSLFLALFFTPWQWIDHGPFSFQPFLLPQFAIFFMFGLVVGANGLERGLFAADGALPSRWGRWLAGAFASFALWISLSAMIFTGWKVPGLQIAAEMGQVLFAASACFAASAIFVRFAAKPWPILGSISENSYGLYLFHYVFVLWTQYLLLDIALPAIVKGVTVFGVTLCLSWAATVALCSVPFGARIIRGQRRTSLAVARATAEGGAADHSAATEG